MNILILYDGIKKRDTNQKKIYDYLSITNQLYYTTPLNIFNDLKKINNIDLIWVDIYHILFNVDWKKLFLLGIPVVIDQADNEQFVSDKNHIIKYLSYLSNGVICSRYKNLPNDKLLNISNKYNIPVKQLTWYFKDGDFNEYKNIMKDIDISYICRLNTPKRIKLLSTIKNICIKNNWTYRTGEYWGDEYYNILSRSKIFYTDASSGRPQLTQKYFESSLCGCTIIGDIPLYPENNFKVYPIHNSLEETIKMALEKPFINKIYNNIESELNNIFKELKLI